MASPPPSRPPGWLTRLVVIPGLLAVTVLAGCRSDPDAVKRQHLAKGNAYFEQQKYAEAVLEYKNAVRLAPLDGECRYRLAEGYVKLDDMRNAYAEYIRASDLSPDNTDLQLKTGNLLLVARRFTESRDRARVVLQRDPNNVAALVLLANALAGLGDTENAVAVTERAIAQKPDRSGLYINLGVFLIGRGDVSRAEAAFQRAVQIAPSSVDARLALGNFYSRIGRIKDAEAAYVTAVEKAPKDIVANRSAAGFFIESRRPERAEPYLKTVAQALDDSGSWLALASYYGRYGREADALRVLRTLSVRAESYAAATTQMAQLSFANGRRDEAYNLLGEVLRRDPRNVGAIVTQANFLLAEQRVEEALARARAAVTADSRSVDALMAQGRALEMIGDPEQARRSYTDALALRPTFVPGLLALSDLHLRRNEIDTAVDYAESAVKADPENVTARLAVARAYAVRPDDRAKGEAVLANLVTTRGHDPLVQTTVGNVYLTRGDRERARKAFAEALAIDPSRIEALAGMVGVETADGRLDRARALVDARLAATPYDPDLLLLAAKTYALSRNGPRTEALLRELVRVQPGNLQGYMLLGQLFVAQGRLMDATAEFKSMAEREPRSVTAHTMLGLLYHAQKNLVEAQKSYERAVQIDAHAPVAANNLAWLLANNGANLDVALQLAQTARAQLPNEAEVADTLGFVYLKKGMIPLAITAFEQSLDLSPNKPTYYYHLGLAHAQAGDDAKARKALEQALKLNPSFGGAEDARRVLKTLVY